MHKILYFHHADKLGGAPLSLLDLVERLDRSRFQPVVCCLKDGEVVSYYRQRGVETHVVTGITTFGHTTGGWYPLYNPVSVWRFGKSLVRFPLAVWRTYKLIQAQKPALVHLNSLTLVPSAIGAKLAGVPLIWHVRETVHQGHWGVRKRMIRWLVRNLPDEVIYISRDNQRRLADDRHRGWVIYNFVDFARFDRHLDGMVARERLDIPATARVALFLGGISLIKGALPLSRALPLIRQRVPEFICLVAGRTQVRQPRSLGELWRRWRSLVGWPTDVQKVQDLFSAQAAEGWVRLLGFRTDVEQLIAASDVVLFPAVVPHFARPVIEAEVMAKPVVASRLPSIEEVVRDGQTGLLVPPNDPEALAAAVVAILTDESLATRLGEGGYQQRRQFDARSNMAQVVKVYERLLS